MPRDEPASTRRTFLTTGLGLGAGTLLAGCNTTNDGTSGLEDATETETPGTNSEGDDQTPTDSGHTPADDSYSVTMAPMGEVTFEAVPEDAYALMPWYADMALALGHGDSINSMWWSDGFSQIMNYYLTGLDGVSSVDWAKLSGSYTPSKERLFALQSDVHFVDPAWMSTRKNWDSEELELVRESLGPWFGNYYSNLHAPPPDGWADRYQYYTLWQLFENVANVYREHARFEALDTVHANVLDSIEANRPPTEERPTVAYTTMADTLESIYVLRLNAPGYYNAHTRPVGAIDAFGDLQWDGEFKRIDLGTLLEADPDAILVTQRLTESSSMVDLRNNLSNHPVGSELSAVQNGRVYAQGTRFQGPIMNLFLLEMTAKQVYPDQFGAWPTYEDGEPYPDLSSDEQLFDHQRVADVINGAI